MSLLTSMAEVKVAARKEGTRQPVVTTSVDMGRLTEFAALVEAAVPGCVRHDKAIAGGSTLADGETRVVAFAVIRGKPNAAQVILYHNGNCVWTGVDPVELPAA